MPRQRLMTARARLLRAVVGFALVLANEPELRLLHRWLDTWPASLSAVSPTMKPEGVRH